LVRAVDVEWVGAAVAARVVPDGADARAVGAWVGFGPGPECVGGGTGSVGRTAATETPGGAPPPNAHPSTVPGGGM
jgi:hypothetical protein